jgi:fermentation-respiration switch protein FrsA (DUF1100 family)
MTIVPRRTPRTPRTPRRSHTLRVGIAGVSLSVACTLSSPSSQVDGDRNIARRSRLLSAETTFVGMRGRYASYRVRLADDVGLVATGRLLTPRGSGGDVALGATTRRYPAVLLNDGRELDSRAIDYLPPEFGDIVVLSLDYPKSLPYELDLSAVFFHGGRLRDAADEVPALFSLGAAYLAGRADADTARIAIAATSFAVPFAVVAAATDDRFRNVALIYGAGDLDGVLAANLTLRPRFLRSAIAWLATRRFRALEPERHVARIAPRPLVMVNGFDDAQMPRSTVESLYNAAREPKTLVWLRTGHLTPTDTTLVQTLVDTALVLLPVLRGAVPTAPPSRTRD